MGIGQPFRLVAVAILIGLAMTACGGASHAIPGPDVTGMSLIRAEHVLVHDHLGFAEELEGGILSVGRDGHTIRTGWIVCGESYVNPTMVGLRTKKKSC